MLATCDNGFNPALPTELYTPKDAIGLEPMTRALQVLSNRYLQHSKIKRRKHIVSVCFYPALARDAGFEPAPESYGLSTTK